MDKLIERAKKLVEKNIFLGGAINVFEVSGRIQLMTMLQEGLYPNSKVLDIGCGCLRGGYWLIHFLETEHYFGIEPNKKMLEGGIEIILEPEIIAEKKPRFDTNANFDFSVFNTKFDFLVARSIWTHASKKQIKTMLDGFMNHSNEKAIFLASYQNSPSMQQDYQGENWVGKSHESAVPGFVQHSLEWIKQECNSRGLHVEEINEKVFNFGDQVWLKINRLTKL